MMRLAVAGGYADFVHLKTHEDLAPPKSREDFQQLIKDLETGHEPAQAPEKK